MSDGPSKIFLSYARDDDLPNPDIPHSIGFVTHLCTQLNWELKNQSPNCPEVWFDTLRIDHGDLFNENISEAIDESTMFLVVLSPNWMSRQYCLREYELFRRRWAYESDIEVQRRIIVVSKRHVDDDDRPPLLRDQDSFRFYAQDEPNSIAAQDEFYGPNGPKDDRYWKLVERLAEYLLRSPLLSSRVTSDTSSPKLVTQTPADSSVTQPSANITISYRRADSDAMTGRIFDRLRGRFGSGSVFRDIDNIPLGVDFRKYVLNALKQTNVLVVVVGPKWKGGSKGKKTRLDDETDNVRLEIETALKLDIPVIPVLIQGAKMPKPSELPDALNDFAFRNGATMDSGQDFDHHIERLIRNIELILAPKWKG